MWSAESKSAGLNWSCAHGKPGQGELDESQELNYRPIMQALLDIKYQGFVGQEFIPTGDPLVGLRQAVEHCDVWSICQVRVIFSWSQWVMI